jgi:hypothetical protein
MAITEGLTVAGKLRILSADMRPEDTYKVALYSAAAAIGPFTEEYTTAGEVRGQGYQPGGQVLTGIEYLVDGVTACMNWTNNPVWKNATINARGALIYNASRKNASLLVLDFRNDVVSTNGPWVFPIPPTTADGALVRLA